MTDDKIVRDTARNPEREALGASRGGIRAAAKRAARKVAKKASQKKVVKKAAATAGKTTKKTARSAATKVSAPASRTASTRSSATRTKAQTAKSAKAATTASGTARAAAAADSAAGSGGVGSVPAAVPHDSGPAVETPRPPGPMHPGAAMESVQEHVGGLGSILALWGPLIIVAFLVLVFRGGDERESAVATGPDVASEVEIGALDAPPAGAAVEATFDSAGGSLRDAPMSAGPPGAGRGPSGPYDGGFTMRTSMATAAFPGRGSGPGMPSVATDRRYPVPAGPYRDPRFRGLPTGESWSAGGAGEWMWSAEGRASPVREDGGEAPVQWVRCAPPYYWCPAPSSPTW